MFDADILLRQLAALQGEWKPARYLVGFSGGLDSAVLVHALSESRARHKVPIVAVHIDHRLHVDSAGWEQHCRRTAKRLEVDYLSRNVTIDERGRGLEAAARKARYEVLRSLVREHDAVLSAHHEEDQAETLLLNLMRGSGPAGIAGIGARQPFGPGWLLRPMLGVSRQGIEQYARAAELEWIDDPANLDLRFDRNYLRREVLPKLRSRWPAVTARLRRSAELASESAALQDDLAEADLPPLLGEDGSLARLDIPQLRCLSASRQRNVLRYVLKKSGLTTPPATRLTTILTELLLARPDAQPLVQWRGAEARRYRQKLYLLPEMESFPQNAAFARGPLFQGKTLELGQAGHLQLGSVRLEASMTTGIDPALEKAGLCIRYRQGGEKIRPRGDRMTRSLKKLLQQKAVVPWMRPWLPLLYAGGTLVAVADLWIAEECARDQGLVLRWSGKPAIF